MDKPAAARKFVINPRHLFTVRPGIDLDAIGRFVDDLADQQRLKALNSRKTRGKTRS